MLCDATMQYVFARSAFRTQPHSVALCAWRLCPCLKGLFQSLMLLPTSLPPLCVQRQLCARKLQDRLRNMSDRLKRNKRAAHPLWAQGFEFVIRRGHVSFPHAVLLPRSVWDKSVLQACGALRSGKQNRGSAFVCCKCVREFRRIQCGCNILSGRAVVSKIGSAE